MAKQNDLTREQIESIIREELLTREGFLDRVMARAKGNSSALKSLGQRGVQAIKLAATGQVDMSKIQDPKLVKAITMAVQRLKGYEKKFEKVMFDMSNDLQIMFGKDFSKVPGLQSSIDKIDQHSEAFMQALKDVGDEIQAKLTSPREQPQASDEEPSGDMLPPASDADKRQQLAQRGLSKSPGGARSARATTQRAKSRFEEEQQ